ncbi:MAG TPA: hypothetical protein VFQ39_14905, partial [Longimicrobium sp.]|nr:hypothetical protein [Longimicrobium sp.]
MRWKRRTLARLAGALAAAAAGVLAPDPAAAQTCERNIYADVVAFDQPIFYNRLGAREPEGMMYALLQDVEAQPGQTFSPGKIRLRPNKRPRPLVLRANVGDCLRIHLLNYLDPTARSNQPATRKISAHVTGMQLVNGIRDDGSFVGANTSSLIAPGQDTSYTFYAER